VRCAIKSRVVGHEQDLFGVLNILAALDFQRHEGHLSCQGPRLLLVSGGKAHRKICDPV
jgi:hypothetical protein